ncbi:unnamed protein product [Musa hybrid cultivar]
MPRIGRPLTIGLIVRSLPPEFPGRRRNQTISPSRPTFVVSEPSLSPFGRARSEESVWFGSYVLSISKSSGRPSPLCRTCRLVETSTTHTSETLLSHDSFGDRRSTLGSTPSFALEALGEAGL